MRGILSAFGKLFVVALLAVAFAFGLLASVYLSLRSPSIQVPDVVNKNYADGQTELGRAGLDMRERARRYKPDVPPGVILDQSPRAGEVVKAGQTIAVVVSRAPKEGEQPPSEEVAEERREEEKRGTRTENLGENANRNANGARRRSANKNTNSNAAANSNLNANGSQNTSAAGNRNAAPPRNANAAPAGGNRNANRGAPNANATRPRTTNSSTGRTGVNANRRQP